METKRKDKVKDLAVNTGILTVGSFTSKVLVFLLVPFYTGVLTTAEYGTYDLSITTIQLLMPILSLNIIDSILRFTLDEKYDIDEILYVAVKYLLISIVFFSGIVLAIKTSRLIPAYDGYYVFIELYFIGYMFNAFFLQVAKGTNHVGSIAISGIIGTVVLAASCIVLLKYTSLGLKGFYIANTLGQIIPCIYYYFNLNLRKTISTKNFNVDKSLEVKMKSYSIPLILTAIGWWVNSSSDKYVITVICGVAANGLLSIAYKIPNIISVLAGIFNQAWQISAIREYEEESQSSFYNDIFSFIMGMTTLLSSLIILFNRPLSAVMFSNEFFVAWKYVPFLIISSIFNTASGLIAPILSAQYKTKPIAISSLVGLTVNLILNICLALLIDIQGVVVATTISSFLIFYIRYIAARDFFNRRTMMRLSLSWFTICIIAILNILEASSILQGIGAICILVLLRESVLSFLRIASSMLLKVGKK